MDIEELFNSKAEEETISDESKKFIFKIILEAVRKREYHQISFEELWAIASKSENKEKHFKTKSDLLDIVLSLDTAGKVLYSQDTKDITLI